MTRYFNLNIRAVWFLVSGFSLLLPVFLPSSANPQNILQNVIGTSTVTMFVLSFPSSLIGIPLLFVIQAALGADPNTIGGMYLNLFLLFVLGLVQWFWVVPRIWGKRADLSILDATSFDAVEVPQIREADQRPFFDETSRTPLERALDDRHEK